MLLLDEPTKGLDAFFKDKLAALLRSLTGRGTTVLMVSHDVEFCASYADRCALFFDGDVVTTNPPRGSSSWSNSFYTTGANRIMPWALRKRRYGGRGGGAVPKLIEDGALPSSLSRAVAPESRRS